MTLTTIPQAVCTIALGLAALIALPTTARAQCAGDCNGDGQVAINELITGVNIALGSAAVSACPAVDANGDGQVAINELIGAVNNALSGCPSGSPTATATPTAPPTGATQTPTVTPTRPKTVGCGDRFVDLGAGETCDDGNTINNDGCPSDCRVERCQPSGQRFRVTLEFATDPTEFLITMLLFVTYPDGTIDVPGIGNDRPVIDAVTSDIFAVTPRDFDYAIRIALEDPTLVGYDLGTAATVEFEVCAGASRPPLSAIGCAVEDAGDPNFMEVPSEQVSCTVTAAP